ncbi:hypothetical protein HNR23_000321 [Nocardiopsis mwathae]|uniref:Uncharacterized protein n=1 Tax=Nocardiopsis mwathae TaxID=1472723 RepID=A0A7W9YFE5_9ACTN|nr:DUF6153 family protein [Nocardiopsis mwathae]MBB6170261.1 hypothetical protein [Nocardiopsis mwathae]
MMTAGERSAACSAWARLLLLTFVLLGVGAMHTLGHIEPGSPAEAAPHAPAAADHPAPSAQSAHPDHASAASAPVTGASGTDHGVSVHMDPTTMCLAVAGLVLSVPWVAAGAFTRWPPLVAHPAGQLSRLDANVVPPASPPSLSALQVLRI